MIEKKYENRVIKKPWGSEYVIFYNKKKLALTYLKIKKRHSTSLHCHPKKKTGFLIISGIAEVQVGIYKENIKKYGPMSILVLRPGLFHKIKASNTQDLYALEIETPYIKKDLVRMIDNYGRSKKGYETLKASEPLSKGHIVFKKPKLKEIKKYLLNNIKIEISYYKNFKKLKSYDDKSISIILDGKLITKDGADVISEGEIVKTYTLKKLSKFFLVNNKILILRAKK